MKYLAKIEIPDEIELNYGELEGTLLYLIQSKFTRDSDLQLYIPWHEEKE